MTSSQHGYEVRPRKDKRGVDLISDALPFGRLWYGEPNAISNAIGYAKFSSRSHDTVIRVCDEGENVTETHEQIGDLRLVARGLSPFRADSAFKIPNNSAQLSLCSLLTALPQAGQEIDCKMPSNYS
jgi:hypothetical protein